MAFYPSDETARLALADELDRLGYRPTQDQSRFSRDKIESMAVEMADGSFDWISAGLQSIVIGPNGEIIGGHHRIVAAHLANIDVTTIPGPRPQVQGVLVCYRPIYDWVDVLPESGKGGA